MTTFKKMFGWPSLKLRTPLIKEWMKAYPIELTHPVLDKSCLVGIEVEVENLAAFPTPHVLWQVTEDGSLRNNGREYISWPVRGEQVEYSVRMLFGMLEKYPFKFSKRCSVHVHMNARTMTPEQVNSMMMLYLVFERGLFKFVGEERDKNIHCVPLYDSNITPFFRDILSGRRTPDHWMKYTALNLCPLSEKGTIEFRHMHGTADVDKLMVWINLLMSIKLYAYKNKTEDIQRELFALNYNSEYRAFAHKVFGPLAVHVYSDSDQFAAADMEQGVYILKYCTQSDALVNDVKNAEVVNEKWMAVFGKPAPRKTKAPTNWDELDHIFAAPMAQGSLQAAIQADMAQMEAAVSPWAGQIHDSVIIE